MRGGRWALGAFLFLTAARIAVGQTQRIKVGEREVAVWRPKDAKGVAPVILFSHGFGGCATQSRFLTDALAEHGYWVFAPNHKDARCGASGERGKARGPDEPFRDPEKWSETSFADRRDDLHRRGTLRVDESPHRRPRSDPRLRIGVPRSLRAGATDRRAHTNGDGDQRSPLSVGARHAPRRRSSARQALTSDDDRRRFRAGIRRRDADRVRDAR